MGANRLHVKEAESFFLTAEQENLFFKEIFYRGDFGMALTDHDGKLLNVNTKFAKMDLQTRHGIIFANLLKSNFFTDDRQTLAFNSDFGFFKITRLRIHQMDTVYYMWMVMQDLEAESNKKLSILLDLYRSFINTTFEMVFRTNRNGKIIFANTLFVKSFGFSNYKKAKESDLKSLFDNEESFVDLINKLDSEKRITSELVYLKRPNETKITGILNASLNLDGKGNEVINWAMLDISEQIDSENKLKSQNEELAKVNHQMEKFLYSTSHDLRSPLTSILGLVNLMQMEKNEPFIKDCINKIEYTTLKLDKIIRDIMSFSRSTYQRSSSEKIDFGTLVWKTVNLHQSDPNLRKINFDVITNGSFPFFGDTERIEIILENIIRNSIHFFDQNKSRPFVKINVVVKKENAVLECIDNGIGIGQQHLSQVFNMFYKASHLSKGAGLGLFIVKETLEKINGTIHIESEIGFGTMVRITIPNDHKGILISRKLELQNQSS